MLIALLCTKANKVETTQVPMEGEMDKTNAVYSYGISFSLRKEDFHCFVFFYVMVSHM